MPRYSIVEKHLPLQLRILHCVMTVKVPFTEKDDFDIERYGDQLTIKVKNPVGNLVNIIPLPTATIGMKLVKAKLLGDELNILFEKDMVDKTEKQCKWTDLS